MNITEVAALHSFYYNFRFCFYFAPSLSYREQTRYASLSKRRSVWMCEREATKKNKKWFCSMRLLKIALIHKRWIDAMQNIVCVCVCVYVCVLGSLHLSIWRTLTMKSMTLDLFSFICVPTPAFDVSLIVCLCSIHSLCVCVLAGHNIIYFIIMIVIETKMKE